MEIINGIIKDICSMISDVVLFAIAIYTFHLRFIKKEIKLLQYSSNSSTFSGDSLSIAIENRTLSPISFSQVYIIYDDMYKLKINNKLKTIKPFEIEILEMSPISCLDDNTLSLSKLFLIKDKYLEIHTSRGIIFTKHKKKNKNKNIKNLSIIRKEIDNKLLFPYIKYIITLFYGNKTETILVADTGIMSDAIIDFNAIPIQYLNDEKSFHKLLEEKLTPFNIKFYLQRIDFNRY